ncbi:YibE/F family protein [Isachenkonia alkalipeptolytica]|nr:YibE/F family protein [Isachenkonia alkalipeptolytica]
MIKKIMVWTLLFTILTTSFALGAEDLSKSQEPMAAAPVEDFPEVQEEVGEPTDARAVIREAEVNPARDEEFGAGTYIQEVTLEITSGDLEGEVFEVDNILMGNPVYDMEVEAGDRVMVGIEGTPEEVQEVHIKEYVRDTYLYLIIGIFLILLLVIGRVKGLKSVITIGLTLFLIIKLLIPGILQGYSPILLAVLISVVVTLITIFIISGFNIKSISAIVGILGGVFIAGIITLWIGSSAQLTGFSSEEALMLLYIPQDVEFNVRGLLFAGIIIGSLGAVMDVGMSIASSLQEVKNANPEIARKDLMRAGFNVGRDIMGTMANTLILAYTGSAIPLLILFTAYEPSITEIINLDIIATEIVRALAGSIGLIMTVPLTVFTGTFLFERYK